MSWDTSHYIQLIIALALGVGILAIALITRERKVMWLLLLLIPFQAITSRYGSLNDVLIYMVAVVFILRGRFSEFPLSGSVLFLLFVYILALSQAPRFALTNNVVYLVAIFANFVLFYMVYNFVIRQNEWQEIWKILVVLNILVLGYCSLQMFVGFGEISLFGVSELSMLSNRAVHHRLTGPFAATAMTAEYFVIQIIMLMYAYINESEKRRKLLWSAIAVLNFGFIVATGNRGGVVALALGAICFLYLFRKRLGFGRVMLISISGVVMLGAVSVAVVRFTEFDVLFDRFAETEFEGIVPDTRGGWVDIWPRVIESPFLGHGPRLGLMLEDERRSGYEQLPYPHNLYMYIFYTIGGIGLLAFLVLFFRIGMRYYRATRFRIDDQVLDGIPRVGLVVLIVFAASEMRMEMLRYDLHDYQQYLFMILAVFLALSDIKMKRKNVLARAENGVVGKDRRLISRAETPVNQ